MALSRAVVIGLMVSAGAYLFVGGYQSDQSAVFDTTVAMDHRALPAQDSSPGINRNLESWPIRVLEPAVPAESVDAANRLEDLVLHVGSVAEDGVLVSENIDLSAEIHVGGTPDLDDVDKYSALALSTISVVNDGCASASSPAFCEITKWDNADVHVGNPDDARIDSLNLNDSADDGPHAIRVLHVGSPPDFPPDFPESD